MRIDIHTHMGRSPTALRDLLRAADALEIDRTVVFAAGSGFSARFAGNDEVLAACREHPDRLIPFAFVSLGEDGPEAVDRVLQEGFRGFKLIGPRVPYNDESLFPVYERIEAAGRPALFHTGIIARLDPSVRETKIDATRMQIMNLDLVARAFPRMTIVTAHMGNPNHEDGAVMIRAHPNVYTDLSGSTLKYRSPEYLNSLLWWGRGDVMYNRSGQSPWDKIVYGSDTIPGVAADIVAETKTTHADYLRLFDAIGLSETDRRKIMGDTAARLLGLAGQEQAQ
jgi:predicted TIM-barrel fold metal-dependent hydrolase